MHAFNGDPHPGNYLFRQGGHVTFLDFGLVKHYTPDEIEMFQDLIRTLVIERDVSAYRARPRARRRQHPAKGPRPQKDAPITDEQVGGYFGHFYEFIKDDKVVTFDPEYAAASVRKIFDINREQEVRRYANVPPVLLISQRINLGLHALLGRMRATANFRRIAEEIGSRLAPGGAA